MLQRIHCKKNKTTKNKKKNKPYWKKNYDQENSKKFLK